VRGRIRTVKPELFKSTKLWDLQQDTGLPVTQAFIGLFCYADREGRFEWLPRELKTDVLPYWDGDLATVLEALASRSYIVRYTVDGKDYGYVRDWHVHQAINNREPPSTLPPPSAHATSTREARDEDAPASRDRGCLGEAKRKGREGNGKGMDEGRTRGVRVTQAHARTDATALHRDEPELTEPVTHTRIPSGWVPSRELYAEALMAGVTPELLDDDVAYWRGRKLGGEWHDIEQFFRAHFPRLAKRRETEAFKGARARGSPDDLLERQAERVEMLRAQEAEEERRAAGGAG
jgi:hypothetical protein